MTTLTQLKKGLSLVEVLVATGIIAVALYGLILATSAQAMAEVQIRREQLIKDLHYQYVDELLAGDIMLTDTNNADNLYTTGANGLFSAAIPGVNFPYRQRYCEATQTLTSEISWTTPAGNTKQHVIVVIRAKWQ